MIVKLGDSLINVEGISHTLNNRGPSGDRIEMFFRSSKSVYISKNWTVEDLSDGIEYALGMRDSTGFVDLDSWFDEQRSEFTPPANVGDEDIRLHPAGLSYSHTTGRTC